MDSRVFLLVRTAAVGGVSGEAWSRLSCGPQLTITGRMATCRVLMRRLLS